MRLNTKLAFVPAFFFVIACAFGQDVHYNYDRGANFAAYRTYQWVETPSGAPKAAPPAEQSTSALPGPPPNLPALPSNLPPLPPNFPGGAPNFPGTPADIRTSGSEDQLIDQEIKRAVDEQLAQKGFAKVEKNADVLVTYHVALHQEESINLSGMAWGGRGSGTWDGSAQGQTSAIPIGTLVIDLYDPARKQLIWRGDATKTIELKKDPGKNYKNLQKALAKLFKNYPPAPNK